MGMTEFMECIDFIFTNGLIPIASMFTTVFVFQLVFAVIILGIVLSLLYKLKED